MNFRLVGEGWDTVLAEAIRADRSSVRLVCPFMKKRTIERFLKNGKSGVLQVITRFHLGDFDGG
jgi:hypothetical protein